MIMIEYITSLIFILMTSYPFKIDTNITVPIVVDNFTPVKGIYFNNLRTVLIAIEGELGVKPSGTYGTVKARLDYIEYLLSNANFVQVGGDIGGTPTAPLVIGLNGNPISNTAPSINDALVWDGLAWTPSTVSSDGGTQLQSIAAGTPDIATGRVVVAVVDAIRLADSNGLSTNPLPVGVALTSGIAGQQIKVAIAGIVQATITGLGAGAACPVGINSSGQLVRATDTSLVPGFYVGDTDSNGVLTIRIRATPSITDYQLLVWTQPTWDIDPINGDDRNTGLLGQPLRTAAEQHRRVGPLHEINYQPYSTTPKVTMYIRSSLLADDVLTLRVLVRPGSASFGGNDVIPYRVVGSLGTPVASGTVTNVRAFDHANNVTWGIQTSLGSMASHVALGRLVVRTNNNSDPNFPQTWWMAKDEGTWQRTSFPTNMSSSDLYNGTNGGSYNIGDTFSIYDLPVIPRMHYEVFNFAVPILINRVRVSAGFVQGSGSPTFVESAFDNYYYQGSNANITNCQVGGLVSFGPGSQPYFTFGLFLNTLKLLAGKPEFQNYVMFQGGSFLPTDGGVRVYSHTRGFQVFDSTGDGWLVDAGDMLIFAGGMVGSGNAGYGLNVKRGGRVIVGGLGATGGRFFRQTGALGDFAIGGRTSGPALDTTTYLWTPDRAYTWDNFNLSVAGGGFNQNVFDPTCPGSGIILDH